MTSSAPASKHRAATESEKSLATTLIGGTIAILVAVFWGSFGVFDNVSSVGQIIIALLSLCGAIMLITSIIVGGSGIAYGVTPGNWNRFDWQVKLGLLSLGLIIAAPIVALLTWEAPKNDITKSILQLNKSLLAVEERMSNGFDGIQEEISANSDATSSLQRKLDALKTEIDALRATLEEKDPNQSTP